MKICIVTEIFPTHSLGGIGAYTLNLARELSNLDHTVTVYSPHVKATLDHGKLVTKATPFPIRNFRGGITLLPFMPEFRREINDYDIIHLQGAYAGPYFWSVSKPKVLTVHTTCVSEWAYCTSLLSGLKYWPLGYLLECATLLSSSSVISITEAIASELKGYYPVSRKKITVIPNGIDLERFRGSRARKESSDANVLIVSRLEARKCIETALRALHGIKRILRDNVKLTIIGSGSQYSRLMEMSRQLDLEENVKLTGAVSRDVLTRDFEEADIFVNTSLYEGMPVSILEALAAGLAIISTRIPAISGLVVEKHNGLLFTPGNHSELARSLETLIRDPNLRERFSVNSRRIAESLPSWKEVALRTLDIYRQAAV